MILSPQEETAVDNTATQDPEAGIDPETGLKKEIRIWLDGIAQAVSEEMDGYEAGNVDAGKSAFWRQKNLLAEEKILWLRNEDVEKYIASQKQSQVITGSLRIVCNIRMAVETLLSLNAHKKTNSPVKTHESHAQFSMPEIKIRGKKTEETLEITEKAA